MSLISKMSNSLLTFTGQFSFDASIILLLSLFLETRTGGNIFIISFSSIYI